MRFYNHTHAFYAGVDLHARSMFTHVFTLTIELAVLLGLHVARRGFWDALVSNSP